MLKHKMPVINVGQLKYFHFDIFPPDRIGQGIYTRRGGISPKPWNSLNLGSTVGDDRENVVENRRRLFKSIDRPVESLFDVWQVHSAEIICVDTPRLLGELHQKADGILTHHSDVTLLMRFADCVPILLYDPIKHVVGLVHAGWQGTVKKIAEVAVQQMQIRYGSKPKDILAGIGPSIGPDHYEVGIEVISKVEATWGTHSNELLTRRSDHHSHFNLWLANKKVLESTGVKNIEIAGICTACMKDEWYSHRAENGKTGRFGAVIYLKD